MLNNTDRRRCRRQNPVSKLYDHRLITARLRALQTAYGSSDILSLVSLLRSGLVRNLGNITSPHLFSRAYAGTKLLIEDYITHVAYAIQFVAAFPTSSTNAYGASAFTSQAKLGLLHDTRQAFGRTALVLQGGAIFGLCHIGVVKGLHLRGLLPRIIVGTATGALVAALVGVHSDSELLDFLSGNAIDLSAFARRGNRRTTAKGVPASIGREDGWLRTLARRFKRYIKEGYFLDVTVLEECVRKNVGEMTFQEAYNKTGRVLNITIPMTGQEECPALLNYLTAPNVVSQDLCFLSLALLIANQLIWSAAVVSNASTAPLWSPVSLLCKDAKGNIVPFTSKSTTAPGKLKTSAFFLPPQFKREDDTSALRTTPSGTMARDAPQSRVAELFNVNHFIVSQARPSLSPVLQSGQILPHAMPQHVGPAHRTFATSYARSLLRIVMLELQHRLRQLDTLGLLNQSIRRFVLDEAVPGVSLTLVPALSFRDFFAIFDRPSQAAVEDWIRRGERSVWPAVSALKVRCAVEVQLDSLYQVIRRRKPMDATQVPPGTTSGNARRSGTANGSSNTPKQGSPKQSNDKTTRVSSATSLRPKNLTQLIATESLEMPAPLSAPLEKPMARAAGDPRASPPRTRRASKSDFVTEQSPEHYDKTSRVRTRAGTFT